MLGISLVTNLAAGMTGEPLDHEEVLEAGQAAADRMGALLADRSLAPAVTRADPRPDSDAPRAPTLLDARPAPGSPRTPTRTPGPSCRRCSSAGRQLRGDSPTGSPGGSSSAPPGCAARSAPAPTG